MASVNRIFDTLDDLSLLTPEVRTAVISNITSNYRTYPEYALSMENNINFLKKSSKSTADFKEDLYALTTQPKFIFESKDDVTNLLKLRELGISTPDYRIIVISEIDTASIIPAFLKFYSNKGVIIKLEDLKKWSHVIRSDFAQTFLQHESRPTIPSPLECIIEMSLDWFRCGLENTKLRTPINIKKLIDLGEHIIDVQLFINKYAIGYIDRLTQDQLDTLIKYAAYLHADMPAEYHQETRSLEDFVKSWIAIRKKQNEDTTTSLSPFIHATPISHMITQYMDLEDPWVEKSATQHPDQDLGGFSRHQSMNRR